MRKSLSALLVLKVFANPDVSVFRQETVHQYFTAATSQDATELTRCIGIVREILDEQQANATWSGDELNASGVGHSIPSPSASWKLGRDANKL